MWGENWGEMIWGSGGGAVPVPVGPWALMLLGFILGVCAVYANRSRAARVVPFLMVFLVPVATVIAFNTPLPHVFTNGAVADANEVNANFSTLENNAADQLEIVEENYNRLEVIQENLEILSGSVGLITTEYYDCVWSACVDSPRYAFCGATRVVIGIDMPEFGGNEGSCNTSISGSDDFRLRCCRVRARVNWEFDSFPL